MKAFPLCFATNNLNKLAEIQAQLGETFLLKSLKDIGCLEDIPETGATIEENSKLKAQYVFEKFGIDCFADDTGLEVEALNNEPGVFSARYAGIQKNDSDNMDLLLKNLDGKDNRNAKFKTVITLIIKGEIHQFLGEVHGRIIQEKRGNQGFGYDPIFVPNSTEKTFAEMDMKEKSAISHRGIAFSKLQEMLKSYRFS